MSVEKHFELTDSEFETRFQNCEFNPADFTHEAHLRLAWIHIRKYGIKEATEKVQVQLIRFTEDVGAKDKYNKTLTIAALKAVYHFMLKSVADNFQKFITEFPRLKTHFRELMGFHYGVDIFNSQTARTEFLEPDLLPFD